jgi:glycerophosphoryl diester phosphodiesterase
MSDDAPTPALNLDAGHAMLIVAHRGDNRQAPENTLPAFALALDTGADMVELDYFHSADGVPVVFHDDTLDRTTNSRQVLGKRNVRVDSVDLADLRKLDAGSWFDTKFHGTLIPTLEEAIDVIHRGSRAVIERKGGDAATCVELLKRKDVLTDVVVMSFDWDFIADCHRLASALTLVALGEGALSEKELDAIARTGARIVGWNYNDVGRPEIEAIHHRGWKAWVYTVNDPARARKLVEAGIDGIITDSPEELRESLDRFDP